MRKAKTLVGAVVTALIGLSGIAQAQAPRAARHEFGLDLAFAFYSQGDIGAAQGESGLLVATPVDVRIGFVSNGAIMFEPRFTFALDTKGGTDAGGNATTSYTFTPSASLLYSFQRNHRARGMYGRVGAGVNLMDAGVNSSTTFTLVAGIGTRRPWGTAALRPEAFVSYDTADEDNGVASLLRVGVLFGLSFWH